MSHAVFCAFDIDDVDKEDYVQYMVQFLRQHHEDDIRYMMQQMDHFLHYSIEISALELLDFNVQLGSLVMAHPDPMLDYFDEAAREAQVALNKEDQSNGTVFFKHNVHIRVTDVPMCGEYRKQSVSEIRAVDKHKLISVNGTVIRTGGVKLLEYEKEFKCKKCGHKFKVLANVGKSARDLIERPTKCPNSIAECTGTQFEELRPAVPTSAFRNYQELKIQDKIAHLQLGSIPRTIMLIVEDDLADICKAGDDVQITGTVMQVWRPPRVGMRPNLEMAIRVNHVVIHNEQKNTLSITDELRNEFDQFWAQYKPHNELVGRDIILKSICPQMHGMYFVKLALMLTLIGGVAKQTSTGKTRGESHLLMVGDPGTGKSQLMKYGAKLSPRYVLTTGIGTTSAGLTAMASKDTGGDWTLEAGALVLADTGVCCIDEFDSIRENDRASIHEAMEQQTLSIAKAGLMCTLNTRTTVIAACNPKGKYDDTVDITTNTALASPLLSRFDICLVLQDVKNIEWDTSVSDFILKIQDTVDQLEQSQDLWSFDKLKTYVAFVKERQPRLSQEASKILGNYYRMQRSKSTGQASGRTTLRLLESLIRLAEAHARLMMHDNVKATDAIFAVLAIDCSIMYSDILKGGTLHKDFPSDPREEYKKLEKVVLKKIDEGIYGNHSNDNDSDSSSSSSDDGQENEDEDDMIISHNRKRKNIRRNGAMGSGSAGFGIGSQARRTSQLLARSQKRSRMARDFTDSSDGQILDPDSGIISRGRFSSSNGDLTERNIELGANPRDTTQPRQFHFEQEPATNFVLPRSHQVRRTLNFDQNSQTADDHNPHEIIIPSMRSEGTQERHSTLPDAFKNWKQDQQNRPQSAPRAQPCPRAGQSHGVSSATRTPSFPNPSPAAPPSNGVERMHRPALFQRKATSLSETPINRNSSSNGLANRPQHSRQSEDGEQKDSLMGILNNMGFDDG